LLGTIPPVGGAANAATETRMAHKGRGTECARAGGWTELGHDLAAGGLLYYCSVAERKVGLQAFHWQAVHFRIGIDEIVEGITHLLGGKADVAAVREENAVDVVRSKEIVVLGRIFPGFGGIDGYPSDAIELNAGPAVVARYVAFGFTFGEGKADFEARGNA